MKRIVVTVGLSLCLTASGILSPRITNAETPEPSTTTATPVLSVTPTPVAPDASTTPSAGTTLVPSTPVPDPSPPVATSATISSRLVVDSNANGVVDAGDRTAVKTLVQLVIWSRVAPIVAQPEGPDPEFSPTPWPEEYRNSSIDLITADDGTFEFRNLPSGDYSVWVWWAGGFVDGATERLPDLYRAIIRVNTDGNITAPSSLPSHWPESYGGEPLDPVKDHVSVGSLPREILLGVPPKDTVPYPVGTGGTTLSFVGGRVDVGAVLGVGVARALPPTGAAERDSLVYAVVAPALALAGMGSLAFAFAARARRKAR